jgi:cytochrome P450
MLHDPDFLPFQPPEGLVGPSVFLNNYLAAFPAETYERPFTFLRHFWPFPDIAIVTDPPLLEEMLIARAEDFPRDLFSREALGAIDRGSLLTAECADWRWQRRAVAPAFRHESLLGFVPTFAACAEKRVETWNRARGETLDVAADMTATTFDIILEAVLGGAPGFDSARYLAELDLALKSVPWRAAQACLGLPAWLPYPGRARARAAADYGYGEVAKFVAAREAQPSQHMDVLNLLLNARDPETGQRMSDALAIANLYVFIFAGHETAAGVLSWALWLLAKDRESQERLRAEARDVCGERSVEAADIENLAFTRQVAQEAMRLFPPAPVIARQAREDTTLGPYAISKSAVIVAPIWIVHRRKSLWDEPHGFDPDRFAPENQKGRPRCAFMPFGAGPRTCIGMNFAMLEIVTVLATLARKFRFSPAPGFQLELSTHVTLRSKHGLPLRVEPIAGAPAIRESGAETRLIA